MLGRLESDCPLSYQNQNKGFLRQMKIKGSTAQNVFQFTLRKLGRTPEDHLVSRLLLAGTGGLWVGGDGLDALENSGLSTVGSQFIAHSLKADPYPLALHIRSGTSPKSRILFTQKHVSQTWGQTVQLLSIYTVVFLAAMIHLFFLITRELPGASSLGGTPTQVMNLFRQVRYE